MLTCFLSHSKMTASPSDCTLCNSYNNKSRSQTKLHHIHVINATKIQNYDTQPLFDHIWSQVTYQKQLDKPYKMMLRSSDIISSLKQKSEMGVESEFWGVKNLINCSLYQGNLFTKFQVINS